MGGGLESSCVGHVYGADGAARHHQVGISNYFMFPHVHGSSSKWTHSVVKLKPVCTFYMGTFGSNPRTTDDIKETI